MNVAFADQLDSETPVDDGGQMPKSTADPLAEPGQPRKRGRPRKGEETKPFLSLLPAPPKFEINKPEDFFAYTRSIPKAARVNRTTWTFYRYFPACDTTEGGTKNKCILILQGEADPFPFDNEDWESAILHLFGSGNYGCYLNEMNKTICRCLNIKTRWDLENYPPVLDPATLVPDHPNNKAYIQWLRQKGVTLPSEADKEREENEMQLAETINKLTDTVIAQSTRMATPVPSVQPQPSMSEKLSFEMASSAIDMFKEKAKVEMTAASQQTNGLELVDKVMSAAQAMNPKNDDSTMKMFMTEIMASRAEAARRAEAAEDRNARLLEKMFAQQQNPAQQPKTLLDQVREMAEMRTLMQTAFGIGGGGEAGGDDADDKPRSESIPEVLIKSLPQLMQHGMGMWGQLNQTLAYRTRLAEIEALKASGQLPNGAAPIQVPVVQQQSAQQQQAAQPTDPATGQPQVEINPATNQPYTQAELDTRNAKQQEYAKYHGFISMIAQPLINHLNDPGHMEDGELVRQDGYDFSDWLIKGHGRLMYDQVKSVPFDDLMGAIKSYTPLWQVIGGAEDRVRTFITEFLTYDDIDEELKADENGQAASTAS